ncbi:mas-related G-protein coupled receptor member X2-like [Sorex araneus]|uniref:mas-related G-protein coupled receptor member X2-like n=1 Tax=Sorex araneus TaxID=42254 RepID=UPI002433603E|nr:mas-related G-protein coupled receptor member X2-like [Sorex araneus]
MDVTVAPWEIESMSQDLNYLENSQLEMLLLITGIPGFIITLAGLAGNAVVIWLLAFRMQRNAFSVYILNLAGADFICLCTHMVASIMYLVRYSKLLSKNLVPVFWIAFLTPYFASMSILTAISTERCLSVLKPIWYRCHRPKHMSSVVCGLLWVLSLLLTILKLKFCNLLSEQCDGDLNRQIDFSIVTWLVFSFVLMFGSSLVLLTRLLCGSQKIKLTRLYVTIGVTVLVFILCGLPWGITYFLLKGLLTVPEMIRFKVHVVLNVLTAVNSCANPIIYFFVGSYRHQQRHQRRSLKVILQRALQDVPEEDGRQGSPPQETLEMSGDTHVA